MIHRILFPSGSLQVYRTLNDLNAHLPTLSISVGGMVRIYKDGGMVRCFLMHNHMKNLMMPTEEEMILLELETGYDLRKIWKLRVDNWITIRYDPFTNKFSEDSS